MRRGLGRLGLAWLAATAAPAAAFDADGTYIVHGTGQAPCSEWTADRLIAGAGAWQLQQWLLGYLTAYNEWVRGGADIADSLGAEGVFTWVDDYCTRDRTRTLSEAMRDLVRDRLGTAEDTGPAR